MGDKALRVVFISVLGGVGCGGEGGHEPGGAAVELRRSPLLSNWTPSGGLTDGAAAVGARFGRTVSISDSNAAVTRQAVTVSDTGTTQAFRRTSTGWSRILTFPTAPDHFPVAVVGANWLIVGEPCGGATSGCHGRVVAFMWNGSSWFEWAFIGGDASSPADFGFSLALDGDVLLVAGGGVVSLFQFGFPFWTFIQQITEPPSAYVNTGFGSSMALSGGRFVIGAPTGTRGISRLAPRSPGFAYAYRLSGIALEATVTGEGAERGPFAGLGFGASVAVAGDRIFVAAPEEATRQRTTYMFTRQSTGAWVAAGTVAGPSATRTSMQLAAGSDGFVITASTGSSGVAGVARFYQITRLGIGLMNQFSLGFDWAPVAMFGTRAIVGQPQFLSDIGAAQTYADVGPVASP